MKYLLVGLLVVGAFGCGNSAPSAVAGIQSAQKNCKLEVPVALTRDPLKDVVVFHDVELENPVQDQDFEMPKSRKDLVLALYNIAYAPTTTSEWVKTGYLGFWLGNVQTIQSVGFSDLYGGRLDVEGNVVKSQDRVVYTTTDNFHRIHLEVTVDGSMITKIAFNLNGKENCVRSVSPN